MSDEATPEELDFNTILWRTQSSIRAFIAGMGAASHEVDDLAQETYLELYRNFEKIPPGVAPERWLKGIARNICLNHFRRTSRRNRLHREALAEVLATAETWTESLCATPGGQRFGRLRRQATGQAASLDRAALPAGPDFGGDRRKTRFDG